MDYKFSAYDPRDPNHAPEVAPSYSPIPAHEESDGLQAGYDYTSGKEAIAEQQSLGQDERAARYGEPALAPRPRKWYRRKRWIAAAVLLLMVVVVAATVGGVVSSLTGGDNHQDDTLPQDNAPTYTTGPDTPASTTSSAAVAPATSGIAAYSCTNGTNMISAQPAGFVYIEHCNTVYSYGSPSIFDVPSGAIDGLATSTKYSFETCVDSCDTWNDDNPDAVNPCLAVTYYADLTNVFVNHTDWGGNCVLKSGVGGVVNNYTAGNSETVDWPYVASAYRACLQQGTPCDAST